MGAMTPRTRWPSAPAKDADAVLPLQPVERAVAPVAGVHCSAPMSTSVPTSAGAVDVRMPPSLLKMRIRVDSRWAPMFWMMRWTSSRSLRSMPSRVAPRMVSAMRSARRLTSRVSWRPLEAAGSRLRGQAG